MKSVLCALLLIVSVAFAAEQSVPAAGINAPDFSLTTNEGKPASLKDYQGKWVILYFYPKDFTSGCTVEARNFQKDLAKFEQANAVILCVHCRSGRTNRCVAIREMQGQGYLPDGTTRLSRDGEPMRHFMGTSTFAEFTVMPEIALAKVSPEASLEGCAPFACGLATGIGAALYTADVQAGSTCVVFGCGLVGLGAVIGCRLAGAERIIAIDLSEGRLESARHHGATDTRVAGRRHRRLDPRGDRTVSAPTTRSRRPATCT